MTRRRTWRRGLRGAATVLGGALLLAAAVLTLEYHTQFAARRLGEYLLERNAQRPRAGAIWQTIEGSRQQRDRLAPVAPPVPDLDGTPSAVLRASYQAQADGAALSLQVRRLAIPLQPGRATRELSRWLARNLAAYRAGQEILGAALLPEPPYRRQAMALLDSLLATGEAPPALDRELYSQGADTGWQLAALPPEDLASWQARLRQWLAQVPAAGADSLAPWAPPAAAGTSVDTLAGLAVDQERAYQEACAALLRHWTDSLYTRDYVRLIGAWTDGEPLRATALPQGPEYLGTALLADSTSVPFTVPRERAARALDPAASGRGPR